jgi:RluA family pseudouridine synthase
VNAAVKLSSPATHEFWEIPVLFEDGHLLALDKPAGLLLTPDALAPERPNLMGLLHAGIADKKPWARERNLEFLDHAHRLDFDTSGVLLLAKDKTALIALTNEFSSEKVQVKYLALAWGRPPEKNFTVNAALAPHPLKIGEMRVAPAEGKPAQTDFEVLEQFSDWVLLRGVLRTERIHQVRVHLKHAGFPVVGDELYGGKKLWLSRLKKNFRLKPGHEERPLIARAALHVEELNLPHPVTGEKLTLQSGWPKDLKVAVKYLREFAK